MREGYEVFVQLMEEDETGEGHAGEDEASAENREDGELQEGSS